MKYFICSAPGTLSLMIGFIIRNAISGVLNPYNHYSTTDEDFYDQVTFPPVPTSSTPIITFCHFRVDFQRMLQEFPDSKIIVITHTIFELNSIVQPLFNDYYLNGYPSASGDAFHGIINNYPHLFSTPNVTPQTLSIKERLIFLKILEHQKILEGYHCLTIPESSNILELKLKDISYNPTVTKDKITTFLNVQPTELMYDAYDHFLRKVFEFNSNKLLNENLVV